MNDLVCCRLLISLWGIIKYIYIIAITLIQKHSNKKSTMKICYRLGETCNHIAALLFRVEAANKLGLSACTSLPCTWDVAKDSNMHLQPLELCKATVVKSRHGKGSKFSFVILLFIHE